jgi:hypothetical protein
MVEDLLLILIQRTLIKAYYFQSPSRQRIIAYVEYLKHLFLFIVNDSLTQLERERHSRERSNDNGNRNRGAKENSK